MLTIFYAFRFVVTAYYFLKTRSFIKIFNTTLVSFVEESYYHDHKSRGSTCHLSELCCTGLLCKAKQAGPLPFRSFWSGIYENNSGRDIRDSFEQVCKLSNYIIYKQRIPVITAVVAEVWVWAGAYKRKCRLYCSPKWLGKTMWRECRI